VGTCTIRKLLRAQVQIARVAPQASDTTKTQPQERPERTANL
jgi:hypothetical protein